jgi:hypothetical protein
MTVEFIGMIQPRPQSEIPPPEAEECKPPRPATRKGSA